MEFCKVREVKSPIRAHETDAGIDFFIPEYSKELKNKISGSNISIEENGLSILSYGRILIPSGIHVKLDHGIALIAFNKSGVASKLGLIVGSCVVDESYMGEVHLSLVNPSSSEVRLHWGQKIVQFIEIPVKYNKVVEYSSIDKLYKGFDSERKDGGFGSTDKVLEQQINYYHTNSKKK